jgi:hypothetical protein
VLAAVFTGFLSLRWWQMPLALLGVMLLISGPSMLIAWLKLRRRNIGPILDGQRLGGERRGQAQHPLRRLAHCGVATLPANAERSLDDPFEEKRRPWGLILVLALIVAAGRGLEARVCPKTWLDELRAPPSSSQAAPCGARLRPCS